MPPSNKRSGRGLWPSRPKVEITPCVGTSQHVVIGTPILDSLAIHLAWAVAQTLAHDATLRQPPVCDCNNAAEATDTATDAIEAYTERLASIVARQIDQLHVTGVVIDATWKKDVEEVEPAAGVH